MSFAKWRKIGDRLTRMDKTELRFRARQELNKRLDGMLSLFGYGFSQHMGRSGREGAGKFFFAPADVDGRIDLLRQRLPERAAGFVEQAEKVVQHRFDLLGFADLSYGTPIDWHLDAVHGKRAPSKVFHRVHYLDFNEVGDSKITWELNRHQHFVTLAKAYRLTSDLRYPDEILRQWRHWWTENPYPVGINWASSLEAAFRSLSWLWTYHLVAGAPGLPSFREEWLRGLALHGRHIERYLSTYFSPNTHLLGEGVALFFLGVLCPEVADAERWKQTGWKVVLEEARRQVRADGFHFEQSTYYHVYALDFFLHAAILASMNDVHLPGEFEETLQKMLEALLLLGGAGCPPRFGDDDGGRVFDPQRNRSEHLLDPLATGAILFHRGDFKRGAGQLREETIWLLGPQGVKVWDEVEAGPRELRSASLPAAGFYVLSSDQPTSQLVVDCGPLGAQSGGHGHADALSIVLRSHGSDLLIDPGTYEYAGGERDIFRGTAMHNTVRVDGLDQAEPATAFSWRRLTQAKAEKSIQGTGFDLFVGSHDGYERLAQPVTQRRWIFSLRRDLYLVHDSIEGIGKHKLEIFWHLGPDLSLIAEGVFRARGASAGIALLAAGEGWAEEVRRDSWSPAYGKKANATVAVFSTESEVPRDFGVMLVALKEAQQSPGRLMQIGSERTPSIVGYRYVADSEEDVFLFGRGGEGRGGETWQAAGVSSDAEFVCWSQIKNDRSQLILVNGSHAEVENGPRIRFKRSVTWGELILRDNRREIFSSDPEAVEEETEHSLEDTPESGDRS